MATILVHIKIREGHEARFEDLARHMFEATHRDESAVREYQYWRGAAPRTYYTFMSFDDHRAFITHQTSDHHEDSSSDLRAAIEEIELEWVDPIDGASNLPPTDRQPAPTDANELIVKYTDLYAAAVAQWWKPLRDAAPGAST